MLSQKIINTVKATIPALVENGEELTKHFYARMFEHNPEVAPFFNPANQTSGRQQKALAGAIVAYAQNIDNLEVLGSAVELIANKHASLMVKPEHYPVVGKNLIASIESVLGDAATPEVLTSWGAAYEMLANILSNREAELYAANDEKIGGWNGFRNFRIDKKVVESAIITSFYLVPVDGKPLPDYVPGQYITVRVPMKNGLTTMRNYSLSDRPSGEGFRISVKREVGQPDGLVSTYLHTVMNAGDTIEVGPPCGEFVLGNDDNERPLIFLAGGIGITPLYSMLAQAIARNPKREIVFVHACLDETVQAFKDNLDQLANLSPALNLHYRYVSPKTPDSIGERASIGVIDEALLDDLIETRDGDYFICGPQGFMAAMGDVLKSWNIADAHIHTESFGPQ